MQARLTLVALLDVLEQPGALVAQVAHVFVHVAGVVHGDLVARKRQPGQADDIQRLQRDVLERQGGVVALLLLQDLLADHAVDLKRNLFLFC